MQGEIVRVRIDATHAPSEITRLRADVALPTTVPTAALIPDIIRIFGIDIADYPLAQWQLRTSTATGEALPAGSTLAETSVSHGDLLVLSNDPGPTPAPRLYDAADALAENSSGIGIVDGFVGRTTALAATGAFSAAMLTMSRTDYVLAAAICFVTAVALFAGVRVAITRSAAPATVSALVCQAITVSITCAIALPGIDPFALFGTWEPSAAAAGTLLAIGIALFLLRPDHAVFPGYARVFATFGSGSIAAGLALGCYPVALTLLESPSRAAAAVVAVATVALLLSPTAAISLAGIRVPRIPAAGEPFDEPSTVENKADAPVRAGWYLDGFTLVLAPAMAVSTIFVLFAAPHGAPLWQLALGATVAVFAAVHSRGHARILPAAAAALSAVSVLLAIAAHQFGTGNWHVPTAIAVPLLAATLLVAIPSDQISPVTRRIAEFVEAIAIAIVFPLVAVLIGIPELISGAFQ